MTNTIRTDRLTLVPTGMEYLDSTHAYAGDGEHTRLMMNLPNDSIEETAAFLKDAEEEWKKETPAYYEFAILLDDHHIGALSAWREEDDGFELGWVLHPDYTGHGYAYEAAKAVMDWCGEREGATRFTAHCDAENAASVKLMEKLGMVRVVDDGERYNRGMEGKRVEWIFEIKLGGRREELGERVIT